MKNKTFATGLGVISAIGNNVAENLESFKNHNSGIGEISLFQSIHQGKLPVGEVKLSNNELAESLELDSGITRTALLGIKAAKEAIENSGITDLHKWRCGLISGTTVGGMDKSEHYYESYLSEKDSAPLDQIINHECGKVTELIANYFHIKDFISTLNTACSSSANSIMLGSRLISSGKLDVVIAGGTDALTKFTLNGFNSLMILDSQPCRPFDNERKGLNLGEGAGFVVLVSDKVLKENGLKPAATIAGYANTNDAYHQTASSPEGRGSFAAMEQAIKMAGLNPEDIDYINLHGTGTQNNDASEGTAIERLFSKVPPASSTKSFTGHTLGASGGIEAVYSILAIQNKMVFPNLRFENQMNEIQFTPITSLKNLNKVDNVMSNSFGFGGNCSCLIFSSYNS